LHIIFCHFLAFYYFLYTSNNVTIKQLFYIVLHTLEDPDSIEIEHIDTSIKNWYLFIISQITFINTKNDT
jgi:hypothetical protein